MGSEEVQTLSADIARLEGMLNNGIKSDMGEAKRMLHALHSRVDDIRGWTATHEGEERAWRKVGAMAGLGLGLLATIFIGVVGYYISLNDKMHHDSKLERLDFEKRLDRIEQKLVTINRGE